MRANLQQRALAETLRRKGFSYREILQRVSVTKSSLSLWLRDIALTAVQKKRLQRLHTEGQKAGARARHRQRLDLLIKLQAEVGKEISLLLRKPFFLLGLALYWAEGTKQKPWSLSGRVKFINSDPNLIIIMRRWLMEYCNVSNADVLYRLYIHASADILHAQKRWSQLLGVPIDSISISLKKHEIKRWHHNDRYIGLMCLVVKRSTWLNRRIELWTKICAKEFLK